MKNLSETIRRETFKNREKKFKYLKAHTFFSLLTQFSCRDRLPYFWRKYCSILQKKFSNYYDFSAPHSRCPLQHKMIVSPSRHLLVAAFIFSVQTKSGSTITYAISFLMSHLKQEWYLDRHSWFERMVGDSVPKMKASLFSVRIVNYSLSTMHQILGRF